MSGDTTNSNISTEHGNASDVYENKQLALSKMCSIRKKAKCLKSGWSESENHLWERASDWIY